MSISRSVVVFSALALVLALALASMWSCSAEQPPNPRRATDQSFPVGAQRVFVVPRPQLDSDLDSDLDAELDAEVVEQLLQALEPGERAYNRQYLRRFGRLNLPLTREVSARLQSMRNAALSVQPVRPVLALDRTRILTPRNAGSAETSNVDQIQPGGISGYELSGLGMLLGQWDAGSVRETHVDLLGRVTNRDSAGLPNHPTSVAATMIGSGSGNPDARGMAPEARLWAFFWRFDDVKMLDNGAFLAASNHSYGVGLGWFENAACPDRPSWLGGADNFEDPLFGKYWIEASDLDSVIRETDHVAVWAVGNDRADVGVPEGTAHYHYPSCDELFYDAHAQESVVEHDTAGGAAMAKNALSIGAVQKALEDPVAPEDIVPVAYTSFGPADDGRIKPDLVAAGENIISASSAADDAYAIYFGSSSAAATVTGAVALLVQKYRQQSAGSDPRAAEMRALLIHTAARAGTSSGPDYRTGYGLLDARAAADLLHQNGSQPDSAKLIRVDVNDMGQTTELSTAETVEASNPIRVVLAWTDPEAPPNWGGIDDATLALVNDLDLSLVAPDGVTVFYPWSLDPGNPTAPATRVGPNTVDNVEVVDVDSTSNTWTGTWTIRVGLNGELSRGQPQAYALVSNVPLSAPQQPILSVPRQVVIEAAVGDTPDPVSVPVANAGGNTLSWIADEDVPWLSLSATSGTAPEGFDIMADIAGLSEPGEYQGLIEISSDDPSGTRTIGVLLRLSCEPDCSGRSCGPDPNCSQLCGMCPADAYCSEQGQCLAWADTCPHADLGSQLATAVVWGSTLYGTEAHGGSCGGAETKERAFSWTAPEAGLYTFSTRASSFDTVLYLRDDTCDGAELACNDNSDDTTSALGIALQQNQRVIAVVDGAAAYQEGDFQLHIHKAQCPQADLGSALGLSVADSSTSGGVDHLTGSCGGDGTEDVAYLWTAPADATYWFADTTFDPDGERVIYLLSGSCFGEEIACHDWIASAQLRAGQQVAIVLDGPDNPAGAAPGAPDAPAASDASAAADASGSDAGSSDAGGSGGDSSAAPGLRRLQITSPDFICDGSCTEHPTSGSGNGPGDGFGDALCYCDAACVDYADCCIDACGRCDTCEPGQPCIFGICWPDPCASITCPPCFTCEGGVCVAEPDAAACDDGDLCTIDDACTDQTCAGTPRNCADHDPCTADACDPATGECTYQPIDCPFDASTRPTVPDAASDADATPDTASAPDAHPDAAPDAAPAPDAGYGPDAALPDSAPPDAVASDTASPDAAFTDASGQPDAMSPDAASEDAQPAQPPSDAQALADADQTPTLDIPSDIRGGGCSCTIAFPSPPLSFNALFLLLVSLVFVLRRLGISRLCMLSPARREIGSDGQG